MARKEQIVRETPNEPSKKTDSKKGSSQPDIEEISQSVDQRKNISEALDSLSVRSVTDDTMLLLNLFNSMPK